MYDGSSRSVGQSEIGSRQLTLIHTFRQLMEQQLHLLQEAQMVFLYQLPGQAALHTRLLRSAQDMAGILRRFYGPRKAEEAASLLAGHLRLCLSLFQARTALKAKDADQLRHRWGQSAVDIARFLSVLNPYWEETEWRSRIWKQMQLLETAYEHRAETRWESELATWDELEDLSLQMADYLASGLIRQFLFA